MLTVRGLEFWVSDYVVVPECRGRVMEDIGVIVTFGRQHNQVIE